MNRTSRSFLLSDFAPTLDLSEHAADAGGICRCAIIVNNSKHFQLVARFLGAGLSFRQVTQVMLHTKQLLGNGSIGSISEAIVSLYACGICAMKLQGNVELLRKCWAFSVGINMATHMAIRYWYIRIRVCYKSAIHDFHLLAVPVYDRHTVESVFNTLFRAMDALYSDWHKTIIGASSDGEKKMTGRHQSLITRIQREARPGFI